jgi:hypothetical protein
MQILVERFKRDIDDRRVKNRHNDAEDDHDR